MIEDRRSVYAREDERESEKVLVGDTSRVEAGVISTMTLILPVSHSSPSCARPIHIGIFKLPKEFRL